MDTTGAVRHMFSHHILKPERTPLEAHPWGTPASSGSFSTLFESRLLRAHAYKSSPYDQVMSSHRVRRIRGLSQPVGVTISDSWLPGGPRPGQVYLRTGDSSCTDLPSGSVDLVITDPPYMDNVHYSELADFFHAWLREIVPFPTYPASARTTRSADEVQSTIPEEFKKTIGRVWQECERVLRHDGLLAFTFHQARLSGWVALVQALAEAGFVITAIQPIKGEMTTSVAKNGAEPSNLDSIIVCRKRRVIPAGSPTTPVTAAVTAGHCLSKLRSEGTDIGPGDIRSVVRGYVLATYTASPETWDIQELAALADMLASERIRRLLDR